MRRLEINLNNVVKLGMKEHFSMNITMRLMMMMVIIMTTTLRIMFDTDDDHNI